MRTSTRMLPRRSTNYTSRHDGWGEGIHRGAALLDLDVQQERGASHKGDLEPGALWRGQGGGAGLLSSSRTPRPQVENLWLAWGTGTPVLRQRASASAHLCWIDGKAIKVVLQAHHEHPAGPQTPPIASPQPSGSTASRKQLLSPARTWLCSCLRRSNSSRHIRRNSSTWAPASARAAATAPSASCCAAAAALRAASAAAACCCASLAARRKALQFWVVGCGVSVTERGSDLVHRMPTSHSGSPSPSFGLCIQEVLTPATAILMS